MSDNARTIVIRRLGSGFSVRVEPPFEGEDLDGEFDAYKNARGWAGGIRLTRGIRLIDETQVSS